MTPPTAVAPAEPVRPRIAAPTPPPFRSPPTGRGQGRRHRSWSLDEVAAIVPVVVLVVVPLRLAGQALHQNAAPRMPDVQETLLAAMAARHLDQLVGAWSRLGLYHPGPLPFYWLAPFVAGAGDQPAGLVVGALVLVSATGLSICVAVRRCAGPASAAVAGVVVVGAIDRLSTAGLAQPWNPCLLMVPSAAGLVVAAATVVRGTARWCVAGCWLGAFVAQCHLGAVPLGALIIVVSIGGAIAGCRRTGWSARWWVGVAVALAVVAPWVPVLVDQIGGSANLGATATYIATGKIEARFPPRHDRGTIDAGTGGALRRVASLTALAEPGAARWGGADFTSGMARQTTRRSVAVLVGLVTVAGFGARPARRTESDRDRLRRWVCRLGLAGLCLEGVAAVRARHQFRDYLVSATTGVGIALWLGAALTLLAALESRHARDAVGRALAPRRLGAGLAGLALGSGALLAAHAGLDVAANRNEPIEPVVAALLDRRPSGTFTLVTTTSDGLTVQQELVEDLERGRRRIRVEGPQRPRFSDRQRRAPSRGPRIELGLPGAPVPDNCSLVGRIRSRAVCIRVAPGADTGS